MFNRIIKRGNRKASKAESADSLTPAGDHLTVTVNFASRPAVAAPASPRLVSPSPASGTVPQIESLPLFRDVPVPEHQALFIRKLQICAVLFDFSDPLKSAREKEVKRQMLSELIDFMKSGSGRLTEQVQEELVRTVAVNIFRSLPPAPYENTGADPADPEEEDFYLDPAWPHLQPVYEIILRYIISSDTDTRIAKRYIDHSFVLSLLDLFDSEDPREREYLKTILHRIYGKFMVHRPFIRKSINNIFYRFIFETERHSGIVELLEILGSIINGLALPMKEEHKLFLVRTLIPLHKPKPIGGYHQQLSYCIVQFVEKDYKLADTVIRGLLKYWPVTNCQKEVLFLGELEEVLEATQPAEFQRCIVPLFKKIACCLCSSHYQVAERSLFLWNNDHIVSLVAQNCSVILPIIFEALEKNMQSHWNQAVHGLTANIRKLFLDMDSDLFEMCQQRYLDKEEQAKYLEEQRELAWTTIEAAVQSKASGEDIFLVKQPKFGFF